MLLLLLLTRNGMSSVRVMSESHFGKRPEDVVRYTYEMFRSFVTYRHNDAESTEPKSEVKDVSK